jgi:hypothetical protein
MAGVRASGVPTARQLSGATLRSFVFGNPTQYPPGEKVVSRPTIRHFVRFFVRVVFQSYQLDDFFVPALGLEKP